ncbi:alpha/beta fold hydrolase [Nitratireductor sp. XY-223]|uniref:alpha/beta fold hydrolase n=1 Tax=Nitratireductor sp. XY-223 TaxID=2561926 RepID=UPI0010AAD129|nr:alpha/beta fold hydrolase [Nitratireductor sp. XY-223]
MKTLQLARMRARYIDRGTGPAVLLVHCSSASHRQWSFLADNLASRYRVVAPDLLGYGGSSPWPEAGGAVVDNDLDLLVKLIDTIGEPVHVVAHSYGAAACLEAARVKAAIGGDAIASLCLVEPVAFHLLKADEEQTDWRTISRVAHLCMDGVAAGSRRRAANAYMGFWLGPLKWRLAPRRFRREVMRTVHKVAAEFRGMFDIGLSPADYAGISCPVTLVQGTRSPQPALRVVDLLAEILGEARTETIENAGHMSPFTHRSEIARIVEHHLHRAAKRQPECPEAKLPTDTLSTRHKCANYG